MTTKSSRSTHIGSFKLDINENLLDVLRLGALRQGAARLQVTREAVLHPLLPRQALSFLSPFLAKRPHLGPKLVHLVVLLGLKLVQTWEVIKQTVL